MVIKNDGSIYQYICVFLVIATVLTHSQGNVLEFTVEPTDTVVESGQSAILDCVVKASSHQSTVLIQWLDQDGQINFSGDAYRSQLTNGSLYLNSVSDEQSLTGSYRCMASLPQGSIVSRTAKLSIASLRGFYEEPLDLTVYSGQRAYFACKIDATPSPKIRWLKDERPFQVDELRMTILPSGSLVIDEVIESDQGIYRCNATTLNMYKLSSKANLRVINVIDKASQIAPPNFIAKPHSQVVIEGQNVSLDCEANGYPKPTITWMKNGMPIDLTYLDSRFSLFGTTSSLRITNIQEDDSGTYQCRAKNREDFLDESATIEVQVPPRFIVKPENVMEYENKDIELNCSVYGKPMPKVQWLKNGEVLSINEYYQIVNGNNLKITGLLSEDAGLLQCVAFNSAGNIQAAASVRVLKFDKKNNKGKTGYKKIPNQTKSNKLLNKDQSIALFSSLKFEKTAKLSDVDFSSVIARIGTNVTVPKFQTLNAFNPLTAFSSLKSSDMNDSQDVEFLHSEFNPRTIPKPVPGHGKMTTESSLIGAPLDLEADAVQARFIILSWKPPVQNSENVKSYLVYYKKEGSSREITFNTSRSKDNKIGGLIPGTNYYFRVVPLSATGFGKSSESLKIETSTEEYFPSKPLNFEAYATGPRSIHVSWSPPQMQLGTIEKYTVYYMEIQTSIQHHKDTRELEDDFLNLSIFTEYSIWVVAENKNGAGEATDIKIIRTFGDIPSEPPQNISVDASSTSLTIRWLPPPVEFRNGIITGYKLKLRKLNQRKVHTYSTSGNETIKVFNDLEKETTYQVKIWAININGTGPGTEWIIAETFESLLDESIVPDPPASLNVRPAFDKLHASWYPPKNPNVKIRNYILGWGKEVADVNIKELDEKTRSYTIERLEPNSRYVISLRASNQVGAGRPVYAYERTQDEPPPEPKQPLDPPMGLKAHILSTSSVLLYWTDTTLGKNQLIKDKRYYVVKYAPEKSGKSRYVNATDLNVMIDDLKPNTLYEFAVKLVKGSDESEWSMVVTNTTWDTPPSAAPRDLDVHLLDDQTQMVELSWQPPKMQTAKITGYIIFYTENKTKSDREWSVLAIKGDRHASVIPDLKPYTEYFFKIQARNNRGYGPFSNVVSFRTGNIDVGLLYAGKGQSLESQSIFSGNTLLYMIIGGCMLAVTTISVVALFLCCRKRETTTSPDRSKKGYQKGNQSIKPPDLWIHHDQMELKNLDKHSNQDAASSSGALTLPRSVGGNDYDSHDTIHTHTSSIDKRTYVPSYVAIATPINTATMSQTSSDSTPSSRQPYNRNQYSLTRSHITVDTNQGAMENPYATHSHPAQHMSGYDGNTYVSQHSPPIAPLANAPPGSTYAPGMNVLADTQTCKRLHGQGHPLKSFTVPAPPPISAPGTPQAKHNMPVQPQVTIRPNCSPFKKLNPLCNTGATPSRISSCNPPPHTTEELQRLQPSQSTEELNQEMANLEGLMHTLNAITSNEFEC